jgi:predicted GNAT family acetyltransferase
MEPIPGSEASMDVVHDESRRRFGVHVDGLECELDYRLADGVMTITHTGVPEAVGGRGIAGAMTRAALEHARAQCWKVVPACAYAVSYMQRHPEFDDLRPR